MAPWWKTRAGKTGIAVKAFPWDFAQRYVVNASSQTSNSKWRTIRRNAWIKTGTSSYSISKAPGLILPSFKSCVCPRGRKTVFSRVMLAVKAGGHRPPYVLLRLGNRRSAMASDALNLHDVRFPQLTLQRVVDIANHLHHHARGLL